jgi:hypothetical protein
MADVSFTTIAEPNPGGVLFVEIPESVAKKLAAVARERRRESGCASSLARQP